MRHVLAQQRYQFQVVESETIQHFQNRASIERVSEQKVTVDLVATFTQHADQDFVLLHLHIPRVITFVPNVEEPEFSFQRSVHREWFFMQHHLERKFADTSEECIRDTPDVSEVAKCAAKDNEALIPVYLVFGFEDAFALAIDHLAGLNDGGGGRSRIVERAFATCPGKVDVPGARYPIALEAADHLVDAVTELRWDFEECGLLLCMHCLLGSESIKFGRHGGTTQVLGESSYC